MFTTGPCKQFMCGTIDMSKHTSTLYESVLRILVSGHLKPTGRASRAERSVSLPETNRRTPSPLQDT